MTYIESYTVHTKGKNGEGYVFSGPSFFSLSFAVWLIDDYTQKEPLGEVRVSLRDENIKAVKNLSGYYTFSDLPEGVYTLRVESELYFSEERVVDNSFYSGSKEPVVEVPLKPKPLYPFPDSATLIRGLLAVETGLPAGVTVKAISKITPREILERTDEKGEFVLYFRGPFNGKVDVELEIIGDGINKKVPVSIEESQSTYVGIIQIP